MSSWDLPKLKIGCCDAAEQRAAAAYIERLQCVEVGLVAERAALQADNERLRGALQQIGEMWEIGNEVYRSRGEMIELARETLEATDE